ncbi:hypothetical protein H0H93_016173 [Arthromyces matolae]|nr:hypothetical protein H0H93_016173 [Arthromyces matolae]
MTTTTATASITVLQSGPVLGKRSRRTHVLHLSSSPEPQCNSPDTSSLSSKPSLNRPLLINGALVPDTKKRYECTHPGCEKTYSKPSRLEEHERSHTGKRPFICETCNKSFLRDTHMHAHTRKHLPTSARPLAARKKAATKSLQNITNYVHTSALRTHHLERNPTVAAMKGAQSHLTQTNIFVRTPKPTMAGSTPIYYSTWTALQHHMRTAHPPTCMHSSCDGRVFASQKGLRAHQKLHEQRDLEDTMTLSDPDDGDRPPRKRRRGGEIGRDWKCEKDGCDKDFKSKKALDIHTKVTHLGRRDFICSHEGCGQAFGYKHLLQRHFAKAHNTTTTTADEDTPHDESDESDWASGDRVLQKPMQNSLDIDTITGHSYAQRARANVANAIALLCPYPQLQDIEFEQEPQINVALSCQYAFSRAYDLRRHLKAVHSVDAPKESVDKWVSRQKRAKRLAIVSALNDVPIIEPSEIL